MTATHTPGVSPSLPPGAQAPVEFDRPSRGHHPAIDVDSLIDRLRATRTLAALRDLDAAEVTPALRELATDDRRAVRLFAVLCNEHARCWHRLPPQTWRARLSLPSGAPPPPELHGSSLPGGRAPTSPPVRGRRVQPSPEPVPASPSSRVRRRAGFLRHAWRPAAYVGAAGAVVDGSTYAETPSRASWAATAPLRAILDGLPPHVRRLWLCGERPGGDTAAGQRAWFTDWLRGDVGAWSARPPQWRDDDRRPVLNVARRLEDGQVQDVEVRRLDEWFGEADPDAGSAAMRALTEALRDGWGSDNAVPVGSPAQTGLTLWDRCHPTERFDPLPAELRELVRSTAGQGRQELLAVEELKRAPLWYADGRLAYAALCWGLPDAAEVVDDERPDFAGKRRARYLADWQVPDGWAHVGLLGERREDRWVYPSKPGEAGSGWYDGAELELAIARGWRVHIRRRLLFAEEGARRPLDTWSRKLVEIRASVGLRVARGELPAEVAELVELGLRSILLHGIGRFTGGRRDVVRFIASAEELAGVAREHIVREEPVGDRWRVTISEERTGSWNERHDHPEWSAAIWARQRRRLLDGPLQTGVLHLARRDVIAVYVDAIYTACEPGWPDDGKPGRFRLKGHSKKPIAVPRTWEELFTAVRKIKEAK